MAQRRGPGFDPQDPKKKSKPTQTSGGRQGVRPLPDPYQEQLFGSGDRRAQAGGQGGRAVPEVPPGGDTDGGLSAGRAGRAGRLRGLVLGESGQGAGVKAEPRCTGTPLPGLPPPPGRRGRPPRTHLVHHQVIVALVFLAFLGAQGVTGGSQGGRAQPGHAPTPPLLPRDPRAGVPSGQGGVSPGCAELTSGDVWFGGKPRTEPAQPAL